MNASSHSRPYNQFKIKTTLCRAIYHQVYYISDRSRPRIKIGFDLVYYIFKVPVRIACRVPQRQLVTVSARPRTIIIAIRSIYVYTLSQSINHTAALLLSVFGYFGLKYLGF